MFLSKMSTPSPKVFFHQHSPTLSPEVLILIQKIFRTRHKDLIRNELLGKEMTNVNEMDARQEYAINDS